MECDIRVANDRDLAGLCEVRNNMDLFKNYFKQQEKKEIYLIVAERDTSTLGFGVLKLKGDFSPKLSDLYVAGANRGKGIGSDLISYHEKLAQYIGHSDLFVSVDPIENPKMIKLIRKLGYKAISEPYSKNAIFYKEDGTTYDTTYSRIDFKKIFTG